VLSGVLERQEAATHVSFPEIFVQAFRWMLLARTLDDKLASLYRAGKIPGGGVYLGRGQEAVSVATGISLRRGDVFAPLIRDGAGRLAFGETVLEAVRTCLGSPLGPMRARDGNVHRGKPRDGYLPMISHLGAMISVVNGTLMAHRFKNKTGTVGAASIGEGGTSTGACHEALNQAAVEKLPLVLVVADNQYAYSTPNTRQFACRSLVDRAVGYGVEGHVVDGTDLEDCLRTIGGAVERARSGRGPQMVVANLLRLCGHGEHDDASYIGATLKCSDMGRDCLAVASHELLENGWGTTADIELWQTEGAAQIEEAVTTAQRDPQPDPAGENWCALASKHLAEGFNSSPGQ
jgi:pyruvate dehydrogenase E1 component alpha subunit/2-oxoisovalerate dehydrogenase E1 component alpha subunit